MTKLRTSICLLVLALNAPLTAFAQYDPRETPASASIEVVRPLSIAIESELSFGPVQLKTPRRRGFAVIAADPSIPVAANQVTIRSDRAGKPGKRTLSGEAGRSYRVILPPIIIISQPGYSVDRLTLHSSVSGDISRTRVGQFDSDGKDVLRIGGTLSVEAGSRPRTVTVPIPITIVYE